MRFVLQICWCVMIVVLSAFLLLHCCLWIVLLLSVLIPTFVPFPFPSFFLPTPLLYPIILLLSHLLALLLRMCPLPIRPSLPQIHVTNAHNLLLQNNALNPVPTPSPVHVFASLFLYLHSP